MKKFIAKVVLSWQFFLFFVRELFRGTQQSFKNTFSSSGIVQDKDQRLKEVQEMSEPMLFQYWTGILGYEQSVRRFIVEGKRMDEVTGVVTGGHTYTEAQIKEAKEELVALEEDLFDMADAYNDGKIHKFIDDKLSTPMYTPHDLIVEENGETRLVNKETGKEKILYQNEKDTKTKTTKTTKAAHLSIVTDK